mgnify:CR=1 FL=1
MTDPNTVNSIGTLWPLPAGHQKARVSAENDADSRRVGPTRRQIDSTLLYVGVGSVVGTIARELGMGAVAAGILGAIAAGYVASLPGDEHIFGGM